jgi:hypothetical protein
MQNVIVTALSSRQSVAVPVSFFQRRDLRNQENLLLCKLCPSSVQEWFLLSRSGTTEKEMSALWSFHF